MADLAPTETAGMTKAAKVAKRAGRPEASGTVGRREASGKGSGAAETAPPRGRGSIGVVAAS